jgi:hypothetical protein
MQSAEKANTNPHFKSKYADLASVWAACREPLSRNGLAILQPVSAEGPAVTVTTILAHSSGEWISESLTMTAQQNTPQGVGSAITYGRRYGLSSMVGIAPDDDDGHAASGRQRAVSMRCLVYRDDAARGRRRPRSPPGMPRGGSRWSRRRETKALAAAVRRGRKARVRLSGRSPPRSAAAVGQRLKAEGRDGGGAARPVRNVTVSASRAAVSGVVRGSRGRLTGSRAGDMLATIKIRRSGGTAGSAHAACRGTAHRAAPGGHLHQRRDAVGDRP